MEDNRNSRRLRPKAYDLRRKVLLKNFLREQMTYLPSTTKIIPKSNDINFFSLEHDSADSDVVTGENLPPSDFESSAEPLIFMDSKNDIETDKSCVSTDFQTAAENFTVKLNTTKTPTAKMQRSENVLKFNKAKNKRIFKAKQLCRNIKGIVKSKTGLDKVFRRSKNSVENEPLRKISAKHSYLSIFKSRRLRNKTNTEQSTTSNKSVQTNDCWTDEKLNQIEQSNKLLQEENRLLSESLSYFMNNSRSQNRSDSFTEKYTNFNMPSNSFNNQNQTSKIIRSKSMKESSEKRKITRNSYRTKSLSCHNQPYITSSVISKPRQRRQPDFYKSNVLTNLPLNSNARVLQRRSSMPERTGENIRAKVNRRYSVRYCSGREPFASLPSEAFY